MKKQGNGIVPAPAKRVFYAHDLRQPPLFAREALARMNPVMCQAILCAGLLRDLARDPRARLQLVAGGFTPERIEEVGKLWQEVEDLLTQGLAHCDEAFALMDATDDGTVGNPCAGEAKIETIPPAPAPDPHD